MIVMPIGIVVTGLDPVIHLLRKKLLRRLMDARIKSGHDERVSRSERRERFAQAPTSFSNSVVVFRHSFTAPRRDAPELCMNPSPKEGVGNAGCPLHPQPRVRFALVKSTRVNEYTGITRRSRTQWF